MSTLIGLVVCVVMIALLTSGAFADTAVSEPPSPPPAQPARKLALSVVEEETGKPVAGATVKYHDGKDRKEAKTDADGRFDVPLPEKLGQWFGISAIAPGRVDTTMSWIRASGAASEEAVVPDAYTFPLQKCVTIGGVIRDEAGNPIAGVTVRPRYIPINGNMGPRIVEQSFVTDAQGKWSYDAAPREFRFDGGAIFDAALEHADYVRQRVNFSVSDAPKLRDGSLVFTLRKGIAVTGRVTDENGNPIKNAEILRGSWELEGKTQSGDDGRFSLTGCPSGQAMLVVKAVGRAPRQFRPDVKEGIAPLDIVLSPAKTLRIRIVGPDDKPIEGAWVLSRQWGMTTLVTFNLKTNADGLIEWNESPDDAVEIQAGKDGYIFCGFNLKYAPQDEPHVFKLLREASVTGSVVDAKTKEPIKAFTAVPVFDWRSDETGYMTSRYEAMPGKDGRYEMKMTRPDVGYHVRIEADGYRSAMSTTRWNVANGSATYDFALEPASAVSGRVLDASGKPVRGADVYIATWTQSIQDRGGLRKPEFQGGPKTTTDEQGRFSLVAQFERYAVIAVNDAGFAMVEREKDDQPGDMTLGAWATIEGRVVVGGKPAQREMVYWNPIVRMASSKGNPLVLLSANVATGEDGTFKLDRVPPIPGFVQTMLGPWQASQLTSSESRPINPQPGERVNVTLNAPGRVIVGKVVPVGAAASSLDVRFSINYLIRHGSAIAIPQSVGDRWRSVPGWDDAFTLSPEGRAAMASRNTFFVKLNSDGTFRAEGLPAGKYDFRVQLYDDPKGGCLTTPIAAQTITLDVNGKDGSITDLGHIEIEVGKIPGVGDAAPDVAYTDAAGAKHTLRELSGKYVVVDFWATWCGPCAAEMPAVKKLHDDFYKRGVVVLGVSIDSDKEALWRAVKSRELNWPQGWAGENGSSAVTRAYGFGAVPAIFLIGPDGKILERASTASPIRAALDKVLK